MTARLTRRLKTAVTTEDAFGTPAAARGSMMVVAGEEDLDDDDLLFDDEVIIDEDETTLPGPIYPEGKVVRMKVGSLKRLLRQEAALACICWGEPWCTHKANR